MLSSLITVFVLGGGFAVYRYATRPPVPAAADYTKKAAPKPPQDPLLQFLLTDEPDAKRPERKAPAPATQPAAAPPRESAGAAEAEDEEPAAPTAVPAPPVVIGTPRITRPAPGAQPMARFTTRDPNNFAPVGLRLEAIDGKSCTINGNVYQVGDRVDNYIVSKVSDHSVVLRTGRTLIELKLEE